MLIKHLHWHDTIQDSSDQWTWPLCCCKYIFVYHIMCFINNCLCFRRDSVVHNTMDLHNNVQGKSVSSCATLSPWPPAGFFPGVGKFIGVARIFSGGVHFFPSKSWRPFLVVILKSQAKTTKWTTPTLQISPSSKKMGCWRKIVKIMHK